MEEVEKNQATLDFIAQKYSSQQDVDEFIETREYQQLATDKELHQQLLYEEAVLDEINAIAARAFAS